MGNNRKTQGKHTQYLSGGMYAGLDVPVRLLDFVIVAGIVLLGILIFI